MSSIYEVRKEAHRKMKARLLQAALEKGLELSHDLPDVSGMHPAFCQMRSWYRNHAVDITTITSETGESCTLEWDPAAGILKCDLVLEGPDMFKAERFCTFTGYPFDAWQKDQASRSLPLIQFFPEPVSRLEPRLVLASIRCLPERRNRHAS